MKKKIVLFGLIIVLFFFTIIICNYSPAKQEVFAETITTTRYNLCVFIRFNDETTDHINDNATSTQTRKDVIDATYNGNNYSLRDYYKSVSSNKTDLKTVYLFPNETGFDSFYLDGKRESYAKYSSTNPNGYTNEATAGSLLKQDWANKIQVAINKGILPCSISSRDDTIPYEYLDANKDGLIDSLTLIFSPQEQTHFTTNRQEPLYPCMDINSAITINTASGKITSRDYNQWTPNYGSLIHTKDSDSYFLSFGQGVHEMGHVFGYRDLYDYYQQEFPVGNMSVMSNLINPVPQFFTSYEREINGWINKENVQAISESGTYTLSPIMSENQTGISTYKVPILGYSTKWVYFEYRNFSDSSINKYDAKDKGLYYSNGNKVEVTSGKSGIVVYIVDKDSQYPTNSHGNKNCFGVEVLGGTNNNRSDAPRQQGEDVNVAFYNYSGTKVWPGITIHIGEITDTSATFTIDYKALDSSTQITREDINNDKVYYKLASIGDEPFYNTSFDNEETLVLSKLDITDISFLNKFDFKKLKYLVLFGNKISNLSGLDTFIRNHPNTLIMLDNNEIELSSLDSETLNYTNVFYGLQNTQKNLSKLEYHINSSFSYDYQVCYQFEDSDQRSLKNDGYGELILTENSPVNITSYYFFPDTNFVSYKYSSEYKTTTDVDPVSLSLNGNPTINLYYGDVFNDPGVNTNYPDKLTTNITFNGVSVSNIHNVGTYIITYTVNNNGDSKNVTRTVIVENATQEIELTLVGKSSIVLEYGDTFNDPGVNTNYKDKLTTNITYNNESISDIHNVGTYTITYTIHNDGNIKNINRTVIVKDTTPPVINLIGDKNYVGLSYSDLGITTIDKSGECTIITSILNSQNNPIDEITEPGEYIIKYEAADKYGNKSSITRNVLIVAAENVINNDNLASSFNIAINYYSPNLEKLDQEPTEGSYIIVYTINDKYGNQYSFNLEKEIAPVAPSIQKDKGLIVMLGICLSTTCISLIVIGLYSFIKRRKTK